MGTVWKALLIANRSHVFFLVIFHVRYSPLLGVLLSQGIVSFSASALDDSMSLFNCTYTGLVTRVFLEYRGGGVTCKPDRLPTHWGCDIPRLSLMTYISAYQEEYVAGGARIETVVRIYSC